MAKHEPTAFGLFRQIGEPTERGAHVCCLLCSDAGRQIRDDRINRKQVWAQVPERFPEHALTSIVQAVKGFTVENVDERQVRAQRKKAGYDDFGRGVFAVANQRGARVPRPAHDAGEGTAS